MTLPKPPVIEVDPALSVSTSLVAALRHLSDPHTNPSIRIRFARATVQTALSALRPSAKTVEATLRAALDRPSYSNTPDGVKALLGALEAAGLVVVFK